MSTVLPVGEPTSRRRRAAVVSARLDTAVFRSALPACASLAAADHLAAPPLPAQSGGCGGSTWRRRPEVRRERLYRHGVVPVGGEPSACASYEDGLPIIRRSRLARWMVLGVLPSKCLALQL
jgi:hypothetical protein